MHSNRAFIILLPLLVLTTLAAIYFALDGLKKQHTIERLETQLAAPVQTKKNSPITFERKSMEVKRIPRYTTKQVTCSVCEGDGELLFETTNRGENNTYACPVCKALGARELRIPRDNAMCVYCAGLGLLAVSPREGKEAKFGARLCVKCNGRGWRRSKS